MLIVKCRLVMLIRGVLVVTRVLKKPKLNNLSCHQIFNRTVRELSQLKMAKKALAFLAPGAEEMEFVVAVDVLVRGGVEVTVAGLPDCSLVKCSRGINIKPDIGVSEARFKGPFDVLVLPGGLGCAKAMAESKEVGVLLKEQEKTGKLIAAICAAPTALKAHDIAIGKELTSYPGMKDKMVEGGKYKYKEDRVVIDDNLITSRGPGTSIEFALAILSKLNGKEKASEVAKAMLVK